MNNVKHAIVGIENHADIYPRPACSTAVSVVVQGESFSTKSGLIQTYNGVVEQDVK